MAVQDLVSISCISQRKIGGIVARAFGLLINMIYNADTPVFIVFIATSVNVLKVKIYLLIYSLSNKSKEDIMNQKYGYFETNSESTILIVEKCTYN